MDKFKKYGKWFLIAAAVCGVGLIGAFTAIGVPIWLSFILGVVGAVPAAAALIVAGGLAWLDLGPDQRTIERLEREEEARQGRIYLDKAKRGNPRHGV